MLASSSAPDATRAGRRGTLRWYADRLASMSPAEMALHVRRKVVHHADDLTWRHRHSRWRRAWEPSDDRVFLRPLELGSALSVLTPERARCVAEVGAECSGQVVAAADRWLDDRVQLFGYPEVKVPLDGDLSLDPFTGKRWPDRHGRLLDYRHDAPGDPKWIWELHRRQEVPLLALAWLLTGESRYAEGALARIRSAVSWTPPGRGIAWANAFEPGVRGLSLAIGFDALRAYDGLETSDAHRIARGLWQHGRWIARDRSAYSSANNHLVGELVGLLAIGLLVPELRDAEQWCRVATRDLAREATRQVLPDGTGAEQAFAYTLFLLDLLLAAVALLESRARPVPEPLAAALRRAADSLTLLVDVDEPDPAYGDADDGRALILDGRDARDSRGVAASLAAYCGHPGCARLAGGLDPTAAVFFGDAGVERFRAAPPSPVPTGGVLPASGIAVLRHGGARLLFDAGPLGYLSIAAHGHADALGVALSHGRDELIADPGAGSYFRQPELRAELRGTRSHATVTVDGHDQAESRGPFLWARHPRAELICARVEEGVVAGSHDGYVRLADPVRHRRAVVAVEGTAFVIYDRLDASSTHELVLSWPFAPGLNIVEHDADRVDGCSAGGVWLAIRVCASVSASGAVEPSHFSRRLEEVLEASRYVSRATFGGQAHHATLLVLGPVRQAAAVDLSVLPDGRCAVSCRIVEADRRIVFDLDDTERPVSLQPASRKGER